MQNNTEHNPESAPTNITHHPNGPIKRLNTQPIENSKFIGCVSPTTNESCSVDRTYLDLSTRTVHLNNVSSPASQMCNPSGFGGDNCENSIRFQLEDVNFIEYEEFHADKQPSHTNRRKNFDAPIEQIDDNKIPEYAQENLPIEYNTVQQEAMIATDRSERSLPSQRQSHRKFLFGLPETEAHRSSVKSVADSKSSGSKKGRRDCGEMPLKEAQSRYDSVNTSVYLQENSKERLTQHDDISGKSSVQEACDSKPDSDNFRFKFRGSVKPTEDSIILDLRDKIFQKDKEIERLLTLTKNNSKDKKENTNLSSPNKYSADHQTVEKTLAEFNKELRGELSEAYSRQQQLEHENCNLKIQIAEQRETMLKFEENKTKIETIEFTLQKEIQSKENEIYHLLEEQTHLQTKKMKLKSIVKQKDSIIEELRSQNEQLSRVNQNEVYSSMNEKTKIYKEKIDQLNKQLETQKEIIKQKETAIDSLLTKLDNLANSNQEKSNQITTLKNEIKFLKEQLEVFRKDSRPLSTACHSHKNSLDTVVIPNQLSKDKDSKPASKRSDTTEHRYSDIPNKKRNSDNFINEKKMLSSTGSRGVFSSTEWAGKSTDEITRSVNHNDSRDSDTLNFRDRTPDRDECSNKPPKHQLQNKGSEVDLRAKNESEKEMQNIEDLQKRLAYLKSKRLEFEKRKYQALSKGREESLESRKEENLYATQTFVNLKALASNVQVTSSSPLMSTKKRKEISIKDKENTLSRYNNYFQGVEDVGPVSKEAFSKTQLNFTEENNSRQSSKSRPPKVDQNPNFNKTDYVNIKGTNKYSNNPPSNSVTKQDLPMAYAKAHKKSYDSMIKASPNKSGSKTRVDRNRSSSRQKEIREYLYKGSLTPSCQSKPSEKIPEVKPRK